MPEIEGFIDVMCRSTIGMPEFEGLIAEKYCHHSITSAMTLRLFVSYLVHDNC